MLLLLLPRKREELLEKNSALEREGKREQAWKLKGQAVEVSYEHISGFFFEVQQSFLLFLVIPEFYGVCPSCCNFLSLILGYSVEVVMIVVIL